MSAGTWRYRKPAVLGALPPGHAVIEASAGTGKTYTLEHLVVELVLSGAAIGQILVVTFTEKAANELRVRVRALLEKLLAGEGAAGAEVPDAECWLIGEAERARLAAALRGYDAACISTIHAFCQQVLTENAFANRRLFEEELADGREQFARAFREVVRTRLAVEPELKEFLALWREEAGLEALEGLLWDCAQRRGRIVPGWDPDATANLARGLPDRDAARALMPAVKRTRKNTELALEPVYDALEAFLAARSPVERYRALRAAEAPGPTQSSTMLGYLAANVGKIEGSPAATALAEGLAALGEALPPLPAVVVAKVAPLVQERLAERKRSEGLYDFQDMLSLVAEALRGPRGVQLVEALRARFRHALIDEFQDTDEVQWEVFRKVFFESTEHRLFLIGDPKQAIYGFRGADVHTYLGARRDVVGAASPVRLAENFRSTRGLIDAYNRVFEGFFSGEVDYQPVSCGRPGRVLEDPDGRAPIHVFVTDDDRAGKRVVLPRLGPAIAREIRRLVDPARGARLEGRPLAHRDVFVLARSASDFEPITESLRAAGIPYAFFKQEGLFQSPEAQALEDVLAAVADPDDRARRYRAWMSPFFGLRLSELAEAREVPEGEPLLRRLREWNALAGERRHERLFTALLEDSGLVRRLLLLEPGERALTNYLHLLEVLRESYVVRGASVEEMVQGLRSFRLGQRQPPGQNGNLQRLETERDAVQLLSMHMSKGLEAPVVFVVGGYGKPPGGDRVRTLHGGDGRGERLSLVGGGPAALKARAEGEAREEDQRLLYVALTRAKARLYLPFVGTEAGFEPARRLEGCYRAVNDRLAAILRSLPATPEPGALFSTETLRPAAAVAAEPELAALAPEAVKAVLDDGPAEDLAPLRRAHAGFTTTSFTRLRDRTEGPAPETKAETVDRAEPPEDDLPGGAATGSFLHEVLARIPPEAALACATPEELGERPEVARLVESQARRWGVGARYRAHALRLLHAALTGRVALGPAGVLEGIARAPRLLREMDFLYPIPEEGHPGLDELQDEGRRPFEIRRGFVVGFVDVLFEHEGRAYFADWKSNSLPSFDAFHVADEVERAYDLQGRLYTLALVKMLGIHGAEDYERRFGGYLFLFLRGLKPDGDGTEGIYFRRPTWAEVLGWERELRGRDVLEGGAA